MRNLILYTAVSLDNFIARPNGEVDWLDHPDYELPGEDYGYYAFYDTIDTTLMGHNTYKITLGFDVPFPYPDKTNYVFSRTKGISDTEHVKFVSGDIVNFVRNLKSYQGKDIWLVGGGQVNSILINAGLVDEMILTLIPTVLGEGIPLFGSNTIETMFSLKSSLAYDNGLLKVVYVKKDQ